MPFFKNTICMQSYSFLSVRGKTCLMEAPVYLLSKLNWTSSWRQLLVTPQLTPVKAMHALQILSRSIHFHQFEHNDYSSDFDFID